MIIVNYSGKTEIKKEINKIKKKSKYAFFALGCLLDTQATPTDVFTYIYTDYSKTS